MPFSHLCLALTVIAIWGANAAIGKVAAVQVPPVAFLAFRFFLTAMLCMPFIVWRRDSLWPLFKIAFVLNFLHYGFVFSAMKYLDASALSLIQQVQVPAAVFLGWAIFREPLSPRKVLGMILGFVGLLFFKRVESVTALGVVLVLLGSFAWALGNVEMKKLQGVSMPSFMGMTTLFSVPFLAVTSFVLQEPVLDNIRTANWHEVWGVLAYQIILGSASMMMWQRLVAWHGVTVTAPLTLAQPVFGVLAGMAIFGDHLTMPMMLGGLVTMLGVAILVVPREKLAFLGIDHEMKEP